MLRTCDATGGKGNGMLMLHGAMAMTVANLVMLGGKRMLEDIAMS